MNHKTSTAASSGLVLYDCATLEFSERLTTRMLYLALLSSTHCRPLTTSDSLDMPWSSLTRTLIRSARGATPMYLPPDSKPLPALMPATKVPWP